MIETKTTFFDVFHDSSDGGPIRNDRNESLPNLDSIHWCTILESGREDPPKYIDNISHALELLGRCWSWFYAHKKTNKCGFVFGLFASRVFLEKENWQKELLTAMGCKVVTTSKATFTAKFVHSPMQYIHFRGNDRFLEDMKWFYDVSASAPALRSRVLNYYNITRKVLKPRHRRYQINVIQRRGKDRQIVNADQLVKLIQQQHSFNTSVKLHIWNTRRRGLMRLKQQADLISSSDLLIAAHGAALTNALFMKPGAAIIELYPHGYVKPRFFRELVLAAGARHFSFYPGGKLESACSDAKEHAENWINQRNVNLTMTESDLSSMLNLIRQAIQGEQSMSNEWYNGCVY